MANEIFISYSRIDKDFAHKLDAAIRDAGIDPWVDWEDIALSADWWEEIQRGIEAADTFVFIISPDSAASKVCNQEIDHATDHNKRIIPVVYRDATDVPHTLTHLNWIFFRDTDDFDVAFQSLLDTVNSDLDWIKAHTRLTVRAVEWEGQNRNDSFVLRGDDLKEAEQRLSQRDKEPKLTDLQVEYIGASQQSAIRRQRLILGTATFGLAVVAILCCVALFMFQAKLVADEQQILAENKAQSEVEARSTAEAIQITAEAEANVAVNRAYAAQTSVAVASTAEANASVAEAKALAARQNAENDRQAAVVAQQTAQAARAVAQTQQAQAEQNAAGAAVAQQTAQASEEEAIRAQQTALAGEAMAEASQATAIAGQATAAAAQATA